MKLTGDSKRQQECVERTIAWLHHVWQVTEEGGHVQPDPFYVRNELLTPIVVEAVIGSIEDIFKKELKQYPGYHRTAQGISASEYLIPPGFDKMPFSEQLAVVQGIDRIFQDFGADATPAAAEHDPVCHMDIEPKEAMGSSVFEGRTYYFCTMACKRNFDAAPEAVLKLESEYDHPPLVGQPGEPESSRLQARTEV